MDNVISADGTGAGGNSTVSSRDPAHEGKSTGFVGAEVNCSPPPNPLEATASPDGAGFSICRDRVLVDKELFCNPIHICRRDPFHGLDIFIGRFAPLCGQGVRPFSGQTRNRVAAKFLAGNFPTLGSFHQFRRHAIGGVISQDFAHLRDHGRGVPVGGQYGGGIRHAGLCIGLRKAEFGLQRLSLRNHRIQIAALA